MQLYYSPNSPFVRKVMVTAHEVGATNRIETRATDVWEANSPVAEVNPLGQIPTLVRDDGQVLYDSSAICEYLDCTFGESRLLPREGEARWRVLRLQALGNGLLNAAVIRALETRRRPEHLRWRGLLERQQTVMRRVYDALERESAELPDRPDLGQIAVACALGYVDLRLADDSWRTGRDSLSAWFERFSRRPSFVASAPPAAAPPVPQEQTS